MKDTVSPAANHKQSILLITLRQILRPFIRLLLEHGITYTMLLEELKRIFVQVAETEFQIGNKQQTDSRITLITGVHRKDVHRIRNESSEKILPKTNFGAHLISQWVGNPKFLDASGLPKVLPKLGLENDIASFESLVASVSKDIRSRPVLDEWLRTGLVEILEGDLIKLNTEAFIPPEDLEQKLFFLGMNIHDHMAATVHNLQGKGPSMMERCVYYDGLTEDQVLSLHEIAREKGMDFLKYINQQALSYQTNNPPQDQGKNAFRMNTGVYFFYESKPNDPMQSE